MCDCLARGGRRRDASDVRQYFPERLCAADRSGIARFLNAILDMAALGFLGMGAQPPTPEWGTMLSDVLQFAQHTVDRVSLPGAGDSADGTGIC